MGEAWHNHHACPARRRWACTGGQSNWGFAFIRLLERAELAWDVQTPENLPARTALIPASPDPHGAAGALPILGGGRLHRGPDARVERASVG